MLHLYAITDAPRKRLPEARGLDEAPLARTVERGLAAVYTDHAAPVQASEEALWRHEHVLETLMADRTVLPVRFGTSFRSPAALRRALRERHADLTRALEHVRGRVELGLRVLWSGEDGADPAAHAERRGDPGAGRAYLGARLAHRERARALARSVHEPLAARASASRCRLVATAQVLLVAAYLVEEAAVPELREHVDRLQREHPTLTLLCTGPWPAYNFAESPAAAR